MRILKQVLTLAIPLILQWLQGQRGTAAPAPAPGRSVPSRSKTRSPRPPLESKQGAPSNRPPPRSGRDESPVARLFAEGRSDEIITDAGVVVHVLPDDNDGSRHQRFLVEVDRTDITIKIAHNLDLAPRVPAREGDRLTFKGEYEWNDLGGALHWTHHDPKRWREGGWIDHEGKRYE
jgi:hypothetical protein